MNKEIGYIWQGFFLLLVVLSGMGMVRLLASMREAEPVVVMEPWCGTVADSSMIRRASISGDGKKLFDENCASCHNVMKDMTGPALIGIEDRVKDRKLLYNWIRNSPAVLKSGNRYFTDLYSQWNKTPMNVFPNLSDGEIEAILAYIR